MPVPSLRSLLATPLHSGAAIPLAGTLGAVVGAGFELVFRSCTNAAGPAWSVAEIVKPALISGWMGIGCTNAMRWLDPDKPARQLQPHEKALVDYPAVRELLHEAGTSVDDLDALKSLAAQLERDFSRVAREFNAYCQTRRVPPNPLIAGVIRHFYLTHCRDRAVMLLAKRNANACYLVAAREGQGTAIATALNQAGTRAGTVLRQLHCPYLRVDLANTALRDAHAFTTDECQGEMRVHSAPARTGHMLETLKPSALVGVTHRRQTRRHCESGDASASAATPTPAAESAGSVHHARAEVHLGPLLRAKLRGLAADSRTLRELDRIKGDLADRRPCGHPVRYQGMPYQATDIHWEGRQSPGRNTERLLYRKTPHGYVLVDIVDYHRPRT